MGLPSLQEYAAAFDRVGPTLFIVAAGSVAVLGLTGLAALAMRRASAAARHEAWVLGFAGVLLLPVLSAALPGWHVLPNPRAGRDAARPVDAVTEVIVELPVLAPAQPSALPPPTPIPTESKHDKETTMDTNRALPSAAQPAAEASTPAAGSQQNPAVSPAVRAAPAAAVKAAPSAGLLRTVWLLLCWPVGSLLVLGRVILGHLSLWTLRRRGARVTRITGGDLFDELKALRAELGIRRPVELLSSPVHTMPMTWGIWRARLLVPEQAADWPAGQRRDVLLHELGHIRRWDCLTHLLSQLACALYWFNPLAWVAARRMQVERERACDDLVLNRGASASAYARHLLRSVSSSVPTLRLAGAAVAAVAMARPSTLEERVRAILDARLNRRGITARGSLAMICLLLIALVPAAVLKAQQGPAEPERPTNSGTARSGRDGGSASPESPSTRPATARPTFPAGRSTGRPAFGGAGGFGGGGGGGFGGPGAPAMGEGPTCTFDATIYDVRIPADEIGKLDVDALAEASRTADAFEKALAALGTAKPMYRANQSVRLSGDSITIGSEVPFVTNSRQTDRGQAINTVTYQSMGALFTLAGKAGAPGGMDLDLGIQVSSSSDSAAAISDTVKAQIIRKATLSHKGPVQPRKPFVVLSVDASSLDKDGKAVAYIGRITVGDPQPPAPGRE